MNRTEIYRIIDRLREECDIRDQSVKLGYITALLDVASTIRLQKEDTDECDIMRGLANLASMGAVRWAWLKEYASDHPICYPSDFVESAEEVYKNERAVSKG